MLAENKENDIFNTLWFSFAEQARWGRRLDLLPATDDLATMATFTESDCERSSLTCILSKVATR